jgi:glutathione S-transferase
MLKLLGRASSGNVQKVMFLLEEIGAPYAREDYGRQFNNTQTAEYKALNPNAKVPTLVDGDVSTWESNTILRYLAASHAPAMHGATPAERTQVERWMDWLLASVNAPYLAMFRDAKKPEAERAPDFDAQRKELIGLMQLLDGQLAGKAFVALGRLTLADIALAPIMARCLAFPIERPAMPNLEAWAARMAARPAFQKATKG